MMDKFQFEILTYSGSKSGYVKSLLDLTVKHISSSSLSEIPFIHWRHPFIDADCRIISLKDKYYLELNQDENPNSELGFQKAGWLINYRDRIKRILFQSLDILKSGSDKSEPQKRYFDKLELMIMKGLDEVICMDDTRYFVPIENPTFVFTNINGRVFIDIESPNKTNAYIHNAVALIKDLNLVDALPYQADGSEIKNGAVEYFSPRELYKSPSHYLKLIDTNSSINGFTTTYKYEDGEVRIERFPLGVSGEMFAYVAALQNIDQLTRPTHAIDLIGFTLKDMPDTLIAATALNTELLAECYGTQKSDDNYQSILRRCYDHCCSFFSNAIEYADAAGRGDLDVELWGYKVKKAFDTFHSTKSYYKRSTELHEVKSLYTRGFIDAGN